MELLWAMVIGGLSAIYLIAAKMYEVVYSSEPFSTPELPRPKTHRERFVSQIEAELVRVDPSLAGGRGNRMARLVLGQHLADERIRFGDPRFVWDEYGAIELAHAYEIDHWDAAE